MYFCFVIFSSNCFAWLVSRGYISWCEVHLTTRSGLSWLRVLTDQCWAGLEFWHVCVSHKTIWQWLDLMLFKATMKSVLWTMFYLRNYRAPSVWFNSSFIISSNLILDKFYIIYRLISSQYISGESQRENLHT
jgi:hypothetical protein